MKIEKSVFVRGHAFFVNKQIVARTVPRVSAVLTTIKTEENTKR